MITEIQAIMKLFQDIIQATGAHPFSNFYSNKLPLAEVTPHGQFVDIGQDGMSQMDTTPLLPYLLPLAANVVLGVFLALLPGWGRRAPGANALRIVFLAASLWSAGYALELLSPDLDGKIFWAKVQWLGIAVLPLAWFLFAVDSLGAPAWLAQVRRRRALLGILPATAVALVWTNEAHHLVWQTVRLEREGRLVMLQVEHGPAFWIYLVLGYLLVLLGSAWLVARLFGAARLHRGQLFVILLAVLFPWLGNFIYISRLSPIPDLDWTPFAFTLSGLLFFISLRYFNLVNLLPIAQQSIFDGQADGLVVLDALERVVDLNLAARQLLAPIKQVVGRPVAQVLPDLNAWLQQARSQPDGVTEMCVGEGPAQRFFRLRVSRLPGPEVHSSGSLVVMQEVTSMKQENAQVYQALFENAGDAIFLLNLDSHFRQANSKGLKMLGYSLSELQALNLFSITTTPQQDVQAKLDQAGGNGITSPFVRYFRCKDGAMIPVEISLTLVHDASGQPKFYQAIVRDISRRMRAEQEQNRLLAEIQISREELRALATRLQEVQEIERRRIASELHDRIGQNLTGLNLGLQLALNRLAEAQPAELEKNLKNALNLVEETTHQVRDVMAELHPPVLDQYGLVSALRWYGSVYTDRTGIALQVIDEPAQLRLPAREELVLFRIVQEALNNAAKHARARSLVIRVEEVDSCYCLSVCDDGQGFDVQALQEHREQPHWGLITMQQRAASIGAQLRIESTPGQGTMLTVRLERGQDED